MQQLAQAGLLSAATNGAVVSQGNTNIGGAPPEVAVHDADVLMIGLAGQTCQSLWYPSCWDQAFADWSEAEEEVAGRLAV